MNTIVTIGRQFGCGGTEVGRLLAEQLGFSFYNREKLREFAVENGIGKILMDSYGEKHASSLLYTLSTSAYSFGYYDPAQESTIGQKAYLVAFEAVKEVAKRGNCVIVGRCADYVLRNHPHCMHVFLHAPLEYRTGLVARREEISREQAAGRIREADRLRKNYYNYYTRKSWGEVASYHLTLDVSCMEGEGVTRLLRGVVEQMEEICVSSARRISR